MSSRMRRWVGRRVLEDDVALEDDVVLEDDVALN